MGLGNNRLLSRGERVFTAATILVRYNDATDSKNGIAPDDLEVVGIYKPIIKKIKKQTEKIRASKNKKQ